MILFIVVGIVIVVVVIALIFHKPLRNSVEKNKSSVELIYIITSVFTILSILFAVGVFLNQKQIEEENDLIILENLGYEIEGNLYLIYWFAQNEKEYLSGDKFTLARYQYYFLEKSLDIIEDKNIRKKIVVIVSDMKQANIQMDNIANFHLFERNVELIASNILTIKDKNELIAEKIEESCLVSLYAPSLNFSSPYC